MAMHDQWPWIKSGGTFNFYICGEKARCWLSRIKKVKHNYLASCQTHLTMYGSNWGEGSWEGDKEGGNKKWKVKYSEHNSLFTI